MNLQYLLPIFCDLPLIILIFFIWLSITLLLYNLNAANPATTVLNSDSKFMVILWDLAKAFLNKLLVPFTAMSTSDWKASFLDLEGPLSSGWADSLWSALAACHPELQALLQSLHLSVPEFPHLQHWNNHIRHLLTVQGTNAKPLKALTKVGGDARLINNTVLWCKPAMLKISVD